MNFERHGEINSLLSRSKGVKISAPELTEERKSFRGWDKAIMTFLKGRRLEGLLLSDAYIPVADPAVSIDNLLQSGCSMENVERHHAVWEILVSCLKTKRDKSLLNIATSPRQLYRQLRKLCSVETHGAKLDLERRANALRVVSGLDLTIVLSNVDTICAELHDVGMAIPLEWFYINIVDNLP